MMTENERTLLFMLARKAMLATQRDAEQIRRAINVVETEQVRCREIARAERRGAQSPAQSDAAEIERLRGELEAIGAELGWDEDAGALVEGVRDLKAALAEARRAIDIQVVTIAALREDADDQARLHNILPAGECSLAGRAAHAMMNLHEVQQRADRLDAAIAWAMGRGEDGFDDPRLAHVAPADRKPYWWRHELMRRAYGEAR